MRHHFELLKGHWREFDIRGHRSNSQAPWLHDNLVIYMMDTLKWIPTINPWNASEWGGLGLDYHGQTVFTGSGALKFATILRLWADVLNEGPATVVLRGGFWFREESGRLHGQYEFFSFRRSTVIKKLHVIAGLADQAASGECFILHSGI